jgi:hypothetical protein
VKSFFAASRRPAKTNRKVKAAGKSHGEKCAQSAFVAVGRHTSPTATKSAFSMPGDRVFSIMTSLPMPRVLPQPDVLRRNLASKLAAMNDAQLAHIYEWFLQLELEQAVHDLGAGLAADEAAGQLSPEGVAASIQAYRRQHPYGR